VAGRATGFIRVVKRAGGAVFYAQVRLPDGRRLQRRLGRAWPKRSRPPEGHLTKVQAEARLAAILAGEDPEIRVSDPPPSRATLGQAGREWLRYVEHDRKLRHSTVQGYRAELGYLVAEFGWSTPLEWITAEGIAAYLSRLVAVGLSDRTANKRLQQLSAIFKRAQRVYGITSNPAAEVERRPERRFGEFDVLEPAEVELLAANAANAQDAVLFTVAAFTGLRLGELLALRWGDLDWTLHVVHVRHSFTRGREGPPKSGLVRSVPLVDQAAASLDRVSRRERWTGDGDLVFVNAVGEHLERSTMRRRYLKALDRTGLKRIRFHDLRHTFGTLAVQAFPLSDVKAFLGHSDIATTMRYIHHVPQHDAAEKLTRLLRERMNPPVGCTMGAQPLPAGGQPSAETTHGQRFSAASTRARTSRPRTSSPGTRAGRRPSSGGPSRHRRSRLRTRASALRPGGRSDTPEWSG
jgi:integrase